MLPQNMFPTPAPTQKEWGGRDGVTADHVRGKGGTILLGPQFREYYLMMCIVKTKSV